MSNKKSKCFKGIIRENTVMSIKEFYSLLGISRGTWQSRKDEILTYMTEYFDYSIANEKVTIHHQIMPLEDLPHKSGREDLQRRKKLKSFITL